MEDGGGSGRRVADYFVVAGLTETSRPLNDDLLGEAPRKPPKNLAPIIDITVIIKSQGEKVPPGFTCVETTPSGLPADLNHGSIASPSVFICIRRGYEQPPLTDIGILYEGKERVMPGCEIVSHTPNGHPANVSNRIGVNNQRAYITYRRASENAPHNALAVIDICVILMNKNESPPHAFCLINKNLNKGSMMGSDVYLCYKKSAIRGNSIVYQADMLSRYPLEDYDDFPLPQSTPFCMPMGAAIECWAETREHPLPVFSTFVLTDIAGGKVYGAAVTFYENYPEEKLSEQQREALQLKPTDTKNGPSGYNIHVNKCVCLLSHWPFFEAFKKFLAFIYRVSISGPRSIPIERHISHFMHEVPFPTPQRPRILMELGHDQLILATPQTSPIPLSGASYCAMLRNLGPEKTLNVLAFLLMEHKLVLHSLRPALLTGVAEAVSSLIFPFVWQCPYIPLCPLSLSDYLSAPMSVVVGIDSRYFDMYDPPNDAICIDIDTNTILQLDDKKGITWKILPKKPAKRLYNTLTKIYQDIQESAVGDGISDELAVEVSPITLDFSLKKKQMQLEMRIQDAFLAFMAMMLKGYSHYLLPITQQPSNRALDASSRFDYPGFLKTRDKASHVFFKQFLKTQMFIKFIEEISFVSENDEKFAFFDDCIDKVDIDCKDDIHLIDTESQVDSEHTVFVMPPDADGTGTQYDYTDFPILKRELFHAPPTAEVRDQLSTPNISRTKQGVAQSPFPRRTKQEMRNSQKMAKMQAASPEQWANYLLGQSYALWFIHLPSYVKATHSKTRALRTAFEVLKKMQDKNISLFDEVCYRVLMQLCGQYRQPVLAVQVFMEMRRRGIKPNAITYGHYNKAVLECQWPTSSFSSYQQWVKLRNTLAAVIQFRRGIKHRGSSSDTNSDLLSQGSGDSMEPPGVMLEPEGGGKDETDLIKLMEGTAAVNLTREEKSSTGNSDMGYASMIMDETTPNDLLTSPELSPTKLARQRDSQCLDEEDEEEAIQDQDNDHDADVVGREKMNGVDGEVKGVVERRGREEEEEEEDEEQDGVKEGVHERTFVADDDLSLVGHRKEELSAEITNIKSRSAPVSEVSTPISRKRLDLGGIDTPDDGLFGITDLNEEEPRGRGSSILRRSRSSVTSREAVHVVLDTSHSSMNGNTSLLDASNLEEDNPFDDSHLSDPNDTPRRRHKSAGEHAWSLAIRKRNSSGGDAAATITDSLATSDSDVISEDKFGCDAKMLEKLRTSSESSQSGSHSRSLSCGSRPQYIDQKSEEFPVQVNALDDVGKEELLDVCHQIKTLNASEDRGSSEGMTDSGDDLLVSINEKNSQDTRESGSGDLIEVVDEGSKLKASSIPNGLHDIHVSPKHTTDNVSTDDDALDDVETPLENGLGKTELYKLESMESLPSNSSSNDTKDSKENLSSKPRKTPKRTPNFLSNLLTSPFTPRMSKQSISRTIQSASSQMETLRTRATDFASKVGEYTRQLSSPAIKDSLSNPNLMDIDDTYRGDYGGKSEPRTIAGSWGDSSKMDSLNPEEMGIHMPGSQFAGSTQSLNNPMASDQEDGFNSAKRQYAMHVFMTSCFRCGACRSALYDEHIMAGWAADDSNLNTSCAFCGSPRVPFLTVTIKDLREPGGLCTLTPSPSAESMQSIQSAPFLKQGDALPGGKTDESGNDYQSNPSVDNLSLGSEGEGDPKPALTGRTMPPMREAGLHHSAGDAVMREQLKRGSGGGDNSPSAARRRTVSECHTADLLKEVESVERPGNGYPANMRPGTSYSLPRCKTIQETTNHNASLLADFSTFSTISLPSSMRGSREFLAPPPRRDADPDPVNVPYLSPLVLRKEIENVIDNEGEECLRQPAFVSQHPIIFWNLIWYFKRLDMPNYLEGALLAAYSDNRDLNDGGRYLATDSRYVKVTILWDNLSLYKEDGIPMYLHWTPNAQAIKNAINAPDKADFSSSFMLQIVKCIRFNNVFLPITMLLDEFKRQGIPLGEHRSIYRELLFLSFLALGKDNVDHDAFDQQYRVAYSKLREDQKEQMQKNDRPPPRAVQMCRTVFSDLSL